MQEWTKIAVWLLLFLGFLYVLYLQGLCVIHKKIAVRYVGSLPLGKTKNAIKGKFRLCHGSIKRVLCLPEGKTYQFDFSSQVTKGNVFVSIRHKGDNAAVTLNQEKPQARIVVPEQKKLYVTVHFQKADGAYTLGWQTVEA